MLDRECNKISFEGIDGAGKTTQKDLLVGSLTSMGYQVYESETNHGGNKDTLDGRILSIIRGNKNFQIGYPVTEALLLASRQSYIDISSTMGKIEEGCIVVADRDIDTYISHGVPGLIKSPYVDLDGEELVDWFMSITSVGRVNPTRTFLIQRPFEKSLASATMGQKSCGEKDCFSPGERGFLKEVERIYQLLAEKFPERISVIDGDRSIEKVHQDILSITLNDLKHEGK